MASLGGQGLNGEALELRNCIATRNQFVPIPALSPSSRRRPAAQLHACGSKCAEPYCTDRIGFWTRHYLLGWGLYPRLERID